LSRGARRTSPEACDSPTHACTGPRYCA
jgi:hypothetical protein